MSRCPAGAASLSSLSQQGTSFAGYKLRSDDYIDANIKLALSAATEVSLSLCSFRLLHPFWLCKSCTVQIIAPMGSASGKI